MASDEKLEQPRFRYDTGHVANSAVARYFIKVFHILLFFVATVNVATRAAQELRVIGWTSTEFLPIIEDMVL